MKDFSSFKFKPFINQALTKLHFTQPTPVQARIIPLVQQGFDVICQAQTGSGKTHTFLLPLFNQLAAEKNVAQVVITTPSRELAYQIYAAAKVLARQTTPNITLANYVGGTDKQRQVERLKTTTPQVIIGTPGRILDLLNTNQLDLHHVKAFVVDEADMTLDMGFLGDIDKIAAKLPEQLQMLVFSATIPEKLRPFLRKYMHAPKFEVLANDNVIAPTIKNQLLETKGRDRNQLIYQLLTMGQPYLALVFCNTKERADHLTRYLRQQNLKVACVHGGLPARERKRTMNQVAHMQYQYVVATDLAARGIDIDGVSLVINDDLPRDLDFFIHRVGRTGRNNLAGQAITLYEPGDDKQVAALEKMGVSFEPVVIKNGQLTPSYDRKRREIRRSKKQAVAPELKGMISKERKKKKPGYKKKIKQAIKKDQQFKHRQAMRQKYRQLRKAHKESQY